MGLVHAVRLIGRLVLVGEAPGRDSIADRPSLALTGQSGFNLAKIAGWEWNEYLRRTERLNLFYDPQPKWDATAAWLRARKLERALEGRSIVLLGAKVAMAFELPCEPSYEWLHLEWANVAKVPHPSGRNRVWNTEAERERARAFLEKLL